MMYMYLLGLAMSNLCVLVTAIPALHDISTGLDDTSFATAFYQVKKVSVYFMMRSQLRKNTRILVREMETKTFSWWGQYTVKKGLPEKDLLCFNI